MSLTSIVSLLSSIFAFILALFVFFSNRKAKLNGVFALFTFCATGWFFGSFVMFYNKDNTSLAIFGDRIVYFWVTISPAIVYHMGILATKAYGKGQIIFLRIGYLIGSFFMIADIFFSEYLIDGLYVYDWGVHTKAQILHHFFVLFLFVYVSLFFLNTFFYQRKLKREGNHLEALRLRYFMLAIAIIIFGAVGFLPAYGIDVFPLNYLVYISGLLCALLMSYAILKHQLLDIKVVIKKAFVYSVIIALISGILVGVSFLSSWFVRKIPVFSIWTVPLIAAIVAFIIGNLFWRKSKEVDKMKSEFITIAAHKLRTPLTKIKWASTALVEESTEEEEKKRLSLEILSTNNHLIELTNQLLTVARAEGDDFLYKLQQASLVEITQKVIQTFNEEVKKKEITLTFRPEENLPKINIDGGRITSVIQVLLENAATYTTDKIDIEIKKEGDYLVFSIEDNGKGIIKKDQVYLFSKFFRSKEAYRVDTEGTGIGLFIAKNIVERHSGTIRVESEEGKGALFIIKLPIK